MLESQNARSPEKCIGAVPRHRGEGARKLVRLSHLDRLQGEVQGRCRRLQLLQDKNIGCIGRIMKDCHAGRIGNKSL